MKIMLVFGTRPEAIKMCPLVLELQKHKEFECIVCLTGQHKEMLEQVMKAFGVESDYNLGIMRQQQTLKTITTGVLQGLEPILKAEKPDMVLVHGDTTTSFAAGLAAFYQQIAVGHVEAGLRTGDIYSPFPEEMNRLLTDRISTLYFAPTELNKLNLTREGITDRVYVTGNTVIDAFKYTVKDMYTFHDEILNKIMSETDCKTKTVLVTAHRRENIGKPLENICEAISALAQEFTNVNFVYPVHMNPLVKSTAEAHLGKIKNVYLIDPIDVLDMHNLLSRCYLVMTDSGGLQEEAPAFGKPVLVLRTETERPEACNAGTVKVVGTNKDIIFNETKLLLEDKNAYEAMAHAENPYGDGKACEHISTILKEYFKIKNNW